MVSRYEGAVAERSPVSVGVKPERVRLWDLHRRSSGEGLAAGGGRACLSMLGSSPVHMSHRHDYKPAAEMKVCD